MLRSVLAEGLLTTLLSCTIAVVLSLLLSARVGSVLARISTQELSLRLSASGVALWLLLVLLGAVVVGAAPARRASRLTLRQTLAQA